MTIEEAERIVRNDPNVLIGHNTVVKAARMVLADRERLVLENIKLRSDYDDLAAQCCETSKRFYEYRAGTATKEE